MEGYRAKILVVDDEESNLLAMQRILEQEAYQIVTAKQAALALTLFKKQSFDLVLTDLRMPGVSGLELLRAIRKENLSVPVVVLTAYGTVNDAVEVMKLGALDFLSKPIRRETLLKCVQDTLAKRKVGAEAKGKTAFIGNSPGISQIKRTVRMLARTTASVLIEGESGTGKEIVAKSIHTESGREGALITVNCGAIPESLLESELFGFEKGAFTGAAMAKPGMFELAHGGTIFLDEIGEMSLTLQVKLLRVLQDGVFFRLGGTEVRKVDVRVVAATNCDLKKKIAEGGFREDLYYRLNVVSLNLPPLRERGEDISLLAQYFLDLAKETYGKKEAAFSPESLAAIIAGQWPGNVRELRNAVERTVVMLEGDLIKAADMGLTPNRLADSGSVAPMAGEFMLQFPLGTPLHVMELEAIRRTLEFTCGDKAKAAELLGINQRTIYRKLPDLEKEI
ncbi:MAG: sigma-54-dependent transcriptional regulator [Bdellovibrionota bacterium]